MSKCLKTFLIVAVLIFSFCFIDNVKAVNIVGKSGRTFSNISSQKVVIYDFNGIRSGSTSGLRYGVIPSNTTYLYADSSSDTLIFSNTNSSFTRYKANSLSSWSGMSSSTYLSTTGVNNYIEYSYYDIWNKNHSTILYCGDVVSSCIHSYNITFHLNGGVATDFSSDNVIIHEENYQINADSEELAQYIVNLSMFKENNTFLGWYYDSNFTQAYDGNDDISSDVDLYAKWAYNPNITFHLNGGFVRIYDSESGNSSGSSGGGSSSGGGRHEDQLIYEDFTERVNYDEVNNYIANLDIGKSEMIFLGWYYDSNFENPFNLQDNIENDIVLYAKWRYENVDDFLANTNFIEYTFDSNYDYAIINRGNNNGEIYIKLPFNNYELEIYEYNENTNTYKDGASVCLAPIYNKNGWYIYDINTLFTSNQEVLILPKYLLEQAEYENVQDTYKFYMTDNAYISYTNNLKHTTITNSDGEQIDTNLQNSYELSEQYKQLYKDEKNIYSQIKIFLKQIKNYTSVIKELFQYLFDSFNTTIRSFIIFVIVLIIIYTLLKFIRRG